MITRLKFDCEQMLSSSHVGLTFNFLFRIIDSCITTICGEWRFFRFSSGALCSSIIHLHA